MIALVAAEVRPVVVVTLWWYGLGGVARCVDGAAVAQWALALASSGCAWCEVALGAVDARCASALGLVLAVSFVV